MSKIYRISSSWKGFDAIRRLVIFGDSYCSIDDTYIEKRPSVEEPLGVPFPGHPWTEDNQLNWVGHFITKYCPEPRYVPSFPERYGCSPGSEDTQAAWADCPFLVHDYAKGGDTVSGVSHQVRNLFLQGAGKKPGWAPWTSTETLFVTWVGINDCSSIRNTEIEVVIKALLSTQEDLYDAGARNFLFIDVPTIHRSPAGKEYFDSLHKSREEIVKEKYEIWNGCLRNAVEEFTSVHQDSTVLFFSSFEAFNIFLNNPEQHEIETEDLRRSGGQVWVDHIHPTTKVHDYIANQVAAFLGAVQSPSSLVRPGQE